MQQGIGSRVRLLRQKLRYGQPEFASLLGLTRAQLAAIESGKTALRYKLALRLRELFGEGEGDVAQAAQPCRLAGLPADFSAPYDAWPAETDKNNGIGPQTLLSEVASILLYDKRSSPSETFVDGGHTFFHPPSFSPGSLRAWIREKLEELLHPLIEALPDDRLAEFWGDWHNWAEQMHVAMPELRADIARIFYRELVARRSSQNQQIPVPSAFSATKALTSEAVALTTLPVQPILPTLLERLRQATATRGRKTELAGWLGVPRQSVNDWLTGRIAPSGETTLRLLAWVTAEEAKPTKSPAGAETPAEPKTQVRKQYEQRPNSDPP